MLKAMSFFRRHLLVIIAALLITSGAAFVWKVSEPPPDDYPDFICNYPPLHQVRGGLAKGDVEKILGPPTREIDKSKTPHNFFQGEDERRIRVGWVYEVRGWRGTIEVYFDKDEKVIRSNCGEG
jgi:hypothetical protein